ncbi:MAG: glutathione S-transferase N-terminal domain-containing protein [Candidatus Wildermuthbacteria bacterium]|nr:glutathione S-transferase N-terminal domain-containing protein [Candidatus Wildermuthbacteria bacterium]
MAKVTIYSTPYCVYCKAAKEFFQEHGVEYEEKDVAKDEEARERMIQRSGQLGVPVIEVDDEVVVGFDKKKLATLLNVR